MKVAPDHDWSDNGDLSTSLQPAYHLTKVLGLELRDTFASVVTEHLPAAWASHLARLEAATAPLQPRDRSRAATGVGGIAHPTRSGWQLPRDATTL